MSILPPAHISTQHWEEWVIKSGVHPEITALNVISLSGDRIYDYLLYSPLIKRRNTGRVTDSYLKRYRPLENGGWWCGGGIDPMTWEEMLWGQLKPDTPRLQSEKGKEFKGFAQPPKVVKYEPPPKTDLRAYFLRVPDEIWDKVAKRYKIKRYNSPLALRLWDRRKPMSFWEWVFLHPEIPIIITEGAKKAGALLSAGYVAIALPGISSSIRSLQDPTTGHNLNRHLIPELEKFAAPGREIYFCFDNDPKPTTRANVDLSIQRTGALLAQAGCNVKVITLIGDQKGVDDFIVANGEKAFESLYKAAVSLEVYTASLLWQLTYKATLRLNQRYLGDIPFPLSGFACVKSPKGTGKTQALDKLITEAQREGRKILVITHRIQLGRAICDRLGLDWIEDIPSSQTKGLLGFGVCIDSVHPVSQAHFNPKDWAGAIVVLDEVEQVIWHLLNSSTCYEKRVSILETFQQLLGFVASTGGLIIAQDADLSNLSIDFIRGVIKRESEIDLQPWLVVNDWLPEEETRWNVTIYKSKNAAPVLTQIKRSLSTSPKAIMIHCDGQKARSKWGTKNLESWARENFPDETILRIDSESVADPTHPAYGCVEKINEIVTQYRIIIASPSIGTGVSIDVKGHFQKVFLISQGVCPESETRQALARLREPVPRFIWARGYGLGRIGNGSSNYKALLTSTFKVVKANIRLLKDFDFDIDSAIEPVATATWAKMASRINASSFRFRDALHQGLIAEGHRVSVVDSNNEKEDEKEDKDNSDQLKTCCDTNQSAENQAVEMVELPTERKYLELKEKRNKTPSEVLEVRKYELKQRYGVEITADLKQKDDSSWYPKIRLHYFLTHDPEFVQMRDRQHFEGHIERGNGRVCLWDMKGYLPKVEALKLLNIGQWFDPKRELSSHDPDLIAWADLVKRFARELKDLGLGSFDEKLSPIQVLQIVLSNLDMELEKLERRRVKGEKNPVRFYRYFEPCDSRAEIFAAWEQRDILAVSSKLQQDSSPQDVIVPPPQNCDTPEYIERNPIGGVTENGCLFFNEIAARSSQSPVRNPQSPIPVKTTNAKSAPPKIDIN
ncbi:MAG: DUF3854 domain-containing protein [Scytonema sp. CRU_2_7]|nr:DUF3854 domain-containing protein [Scytonema sp. CRU_2_7]